MATISRPQHVSLSYCDSISFSDLNATSPKGDVFMMADITSF